MGTRGEHGQGKAMKIQRHTELDVYKKAFEVAMSIFEASKPFPREEMYSLTDQIRRSSRSVCANIAEAWRKRRYEAAFIAKLSDAESEAAETQVWLEFAVKCGYLDLACATECCQGCEGVLRMLVAMINAPQTWTISQTEQ
jgi:four helix bundle protein